MKVLIVLSAVVAVSLAGYIPAGFHSVYAAPSVYSVGVSSIHHAQDALGQYNYGYVSPLSSKGEVKTADGVTHGGYSYVDANGVVQSVSYTADAIHGFRVAASNLPQAPVEAPKPVEDTVEVAAAKSEHLAAVAKAGGAVEVAPVPVEVPQPVQDTPEVVAAKAAHAAAHEIAKSAVVVPSVYSYSAYAPGVVPVAPGHGFAYSAIAAAPVVSPYHYSHVAPVVLTSDGVPVDTPEVQAAKAANAIAHIQAKAALLV